MSTEPADRALFERIVSGPPYECETTRWHPASLRGDAYKNYTLHFAWDVLNDYLKAKPALTDERIDRIADITARAMDGGIAGFCKTWGYRQFARALLEDCAGHHRDRPAMTEAEILRIHEREACPPDLVGMKNQWPEIVAFARAIERDHWRTRMTEPTEAQVDAACKAAFVEASVNQRYDMRRALRAALSAQVPQEVPADAMTLTDKQMFDMILEHAVPGKPPYFPDPRALRDALIDLCKRYETLHRISAPYLYDLRSLPAQSDLDLALETARIALAAQPASEPRALPNEREAFEREFRAKGELDRNARGDYAFCDMQAAWEGWQARASAASPPEEPAQADECVTTIDGAHNFGPHGPDGTTQCKWCGETPPAPANPPAPRAESPQPDCEGQPGECEHHGACMYACGRTCPPSTDAAPRAESEAGEALLDNLAALVRQLVRRLRKAAPGDDLPARALDYLKRSGLQGNPMRSGDDEGVE